MNPQAVALQQRLLDDATRKLQEHAYYMQQATDEKNLPVVLDRAAYMVGELGGPLHGHQNSHQSSASSSGSSRPSNTGCSAKLNPKNNYYELYMRALEEMPGLEDYLFNLVRSPEALAAQKQKEQEQLDQQQAPLNPGDRMISIIVNPAAKTAAPPTYSMRELYDCVLYCPRVVSRLYLQIAAGSALIRSEEVGAAWVMNDLIQSVRSEQNPVRGLFLWHYLLTALRNKLPDTPVAPPSPQQQQQRSSSLFMLSVEMTLLCPERRFLDL